MDATIDQVKLDIEKGFRFWKMHAESYGAMDPDKRALACMSEAESRVTAFLTQVEADREQLRKALLACQTLADAANDACLDGYNMAVALADEALKPA